MTSHLRAGTGGERFISKSRDYRALPPFYRTSRFHIRQGKNHFRERGKWSNFFSVLHAFEASVRCMGRDVHRYARKEFVHVRRGMKTVLVVDDDIEFREIFSLMLLELNCAVWQASSTAEAFEILEHEELFDYIFCDLHIPFTLESDSDKYQYSKEVGIRTLSEFSMLYKNDVTLIAISAAEESDQDLVRQRLGCKVPLLGKPIRREQLNMILNDDLSRDIISHISAPNDLSLLVQ
ncbi:response regulator [bacterium]|nr:response regulator [bacterium]